MEHFVSFTVVVLSQLIFFCLHAYLVGETDKIIKYLKIGALLGLPFGVLFDIVVGKMAGVFYYEFGFAWWFLIINGVFSFGFMMANVLLLRGHSLLHMYLWSVGLGLTYEIVNWKFPVWHWNFAPTYLEYTVVVLAAYTGLAWLMMLTLRVAKGYRFTLIPF